VELQSLNDASVVLYEGLEKKSLSILVVVWSNWFLSCWVLGISLCLNREEN